ncbi:hypothetical protein [Aeromonas veronii]|uniref:hypothetical protein n=1 Tax=Aeromonas veronii TaxID=654 RepID=UPI002444AADF|nr:hypothetical protein [Aeromonas veronii]
MRKKVCLVGYYGYGNFGDDLMLKLLTELLIAQHYDVSVISKNKCNFISDKVNQIITEGRWLTWVYIYNFIKHNAIVWGGGDLSLLYK